jgi:hypothetical protein
MTRQEAQESVDRFNAYYETLTEEKKQDYYGGKSSTIANYEWCWCGNKEFRPFKEGDCPEGVTIGPVIYENPVGLEDGAYGGFIGE